MRDQMDNHHAQHLKDKDEIGQLGQLYKVRGISPRLSQTQSGNSVNLGWSRKIHILQKKKSLGQKFDRPSSFHLFLTEKLD